MSRNGDPTNNLTFSCKSFDGMSDLRSFLQINGPHSSANSGVSDHWAGGSFFDAITRLSEGNMGMVPKSDELLTKFEAIEIETPKKGWRNDVVGERANVQAHLKGHPMAMRRRSREDNAFSPVTVFVNVAASSMFSAEQIQKRGIAILAFVRLLAMRRPVELYVGLISRGYSNNMSCIAVRMDTAPLDLARISFALADPCFMRRAMINMAYYYGGEGGLPQCHGKDDFLAAVKKVLPTIGTQIVAIPHMTSANEDAVHDPEAFIERMLRETDLSDLSEVSEEVGDDEESA